MKDNHTEPVILIKQLEPRQNTLLMFYTTGKNGILTQERSGGLMEITFPRRDRLLSPSFPNTHLSLVNNFYFVSTHT